MDRSTLRKAGIAGTVALGTIMVPTAAFAAPAAPAIDFGPAIQTAVTSGTGVLTSNVLLLFALPALWVGYRVARKVITKVG